MKRARKAWNGGSRDAAAKAATAATEAAIASGCQRCPRCGGQGVRPGNPPRICRNCDAAGFLVPPGGMPEAVRP